MPRQSDSDMPYVVAVVLTWKDTEMSARCIRSLQSNTYPHKDVVLVDNGSNPPGCPILKEQFPDIEPVQLDRNYGFTGGCNRGIERALELGADYIFLLNNDTIVHEEAIARLVEAMEARPDAALATALLLYPGEERRIQFFRGELQRNIARHVHPGEGQTVSEEFQRTVETEFAPACAVLFRRKALEEVGLFDERLFTNWEDYDLCCRFQDAGWKLLTVGSAEVIHAHGQTTGRISPFITYFFTRNRLICLFRHGRLPGILRESPMLARSFLWQVRAYGYDNWPAHKAFLKGFTSFLLGIRGEGGAPADRRDRRKQQTA
jgi:GT2 family glycosyltransferase